MCNLPPCHSDPLGHGSNGGGKSLTGAHKWVMLSTWLLKPPSGSYPLVSTNMGYKSLHILYPLREMYQYPSSSNLLGTNFPVMFHLKFLTIQLNHVPQPANWYRPTPCGHFFLQAKCTTRCTVPGSAPGRISLHLSSRDAPGRDCHASVSTFGL